MTLDDVKQKAICCITDKPLVTSEHMNMIRLNLKASWEFPVWGNFITGVNGMAIAYVHDDAVDQHTGKLKGNVKFAIEISDNTIIYHSVGELLSVQPVNQN